jgi:CRP/FNR family transcriptional regulator, dissimilatory nitrate respiration regulator
VRVAQREQGAVETEAADTLLASIQLFALMDQKTLSRIAKGAVRIDAARGTMLFSPGDPSDGLHAVVSGRVKLALPGNDGSEKVISLIGPGHTFGQSAMFLDEPHIVSAVTLTAATLVRVSKSTILACMRRDPQFALRMIAALSRQLRELIREIASSALYSGTERIISFILSELPASASGPMTLILPAKKGVIASRLDLTHEHFSRILHDLAAAGLIVVQGAKVTILDVRRLRAYRG